MKTAIIVHGICDENEYFEMNFPSPSNAHWIPWLQQKLLRNNIHCQTPEMPTPFKPTYEEWKETFEQYNLNSESLYIGHSAGCGFLCRYLTENPNTYFKKIIFVAPWLDPDKETGEFLDFNFNLNLSEFAENVHIINSNDDMKSVIKTKDIILEKSSSINYHEYDGCGHFCLGDIGPEFIDLFNICVEK